VSWVYTCLPMGFVFRAFLASFLAALVVHARPSSLSLSFRASLPRMVVGNKGAIVSTNSLRMILCGFVVVIVGSMMCSWLSQQCVFCFHVVEDFLWKLCGMCVHQDQLRFKVCGCIHWRGSSFRSFWCSCSEKLILGLLIFSLSKRVCSRVGIEEREKRREGKRRCGREGGREGGSVW